MRKRVTRLFHWAGRRYEPGDLFDMSRLTVGQVASLTRLLGLEDPPKKAKKKKLPDAVQEYLDDEVALLIGEKDE